ncbi:MAG: ABC transporter substrate-binding protein [Rhodospirillales bacterium]
MIFRTLLIAAATLAGFIPPAPAYDMKEPPVLAPLVAEGRLPPVAQRIPANPLITDLEAAGRKTGRYGGQLRTIFSQEKDVRLMNVYGYARLVGYDEKLELKPDILAAVDVEDGRIFTLHLRKGHRWSDGEYFTAEDFRYFWEDVAGNELLSPSGVPVEMMVGGKPPRFEVIDDWTVRYSWEQANPNFLPMLADPRPLYIYRPAHYLKPFHENYADHAELARKVEEHRRKNWAQLHNRIGHMYNNTNPDLPTLEPWVIVTEAPADRYLFRRNPFFHRIDTAGHQLPYIDEVSATIAAGGVVPIKTGTGESDLQGRGITFNDFTFLKQNEEHYGFTVDLWRLGLGSVMALYPNLNTRDETWRAVFRDVRVRRALSLAINREELNEVLFYGLAMPAANTVLPSSPLFDRRYQQAWTAFDLDRANALLDEAGLAGRDDRGIRLLPDGRAMEITVETAGESPQQIDALQLIKDTWLDIGVKIHIRNSPRESFRNRIFAGQTLISVWPGLDNAVPTADQAPAEIAPTSQQQLQWPKWGQHIETKGEAGEPVDMPEALRLVELEKAWALAKSTAERRGIWAEMLQIYADQVFSIGTICCTVHPVVHRNGLMNVPAEGLWAWAPTAQFGMYRPDTFFWAKP